MVWGCISPYGKDNLHICKGVINAGKCEQILEQHTLNSLLNPSSFPILFRKGFAYFIETVYPHPAFITPASMLLLLKYHKNS